MRRKRGLNLSLPFTSAPLPKLARNRTVFLGAIYAKGTNDVTRNPVTAYIWWSAAAVGATAANDAEMAVLVTKQRDTLATTMTAAQITEAKTLAKQ